MALASFLPFQNAAASIAAINAPSTVCAGSTGNQASVTNQAGLTYGWAIDGGDITAGANSSAITFNAGTNASLLLTVYVTNQLNSVFNESFSSLAGWSSYGEASVTHQSSGGNPGGFARLTFNAPPPPPGSFFPRTVGFVAATNASGGNLTGSVGGTGNRAIRFSFRPVSVLPDLLFLEFTDGSDYWSYVIDSEGLSLNAWNELTISLNYDPENWVSSGLQNFFAFSDSLNSVTEWNVTLIQTTQAATSFDIDNFEIVDLSPETGTAVVAINQPSNGGTATATDTAVCLNSGTTISLAGHTGAIQWQDSADGLDFTNVAGATNTVLSTGNLTTTRYFRAVVTSGTCAPATSSVATVTVDQPSFGGVIISTTTNVICSGGGITMASSNRIGNVTGWESSTDLVDWTLVPQPTGSFKATGIATTTYYRVIVQNGACPPATSTVFTVNVITNLPVMTLAPVDQVACEGDTVTFTFAADYAVSYGMASRSPGGALSRPILLGAAQSFTITNVTADLDGKEYILIVTGLCGSTTNDPVTLTVNTAPAITTQPASATVDSGQTASFSVGALGSALSYQWQVRASPEAPWEDIAGATNLTYETGSLGTSDSGRAYRVMLNGTCGVVTSEPATLEVNQPVYHTLTIARSIGGTTTPDAGQYSYLEGSTATVTAVAAPFRDFAGWSGDVTSGDATLDIVMNTNKSVFATFVEQRQEGITPNWWIDLYGLGTNDLLDTDGDGVTDRDEFIANTDPTNPNDKFELITSFSGGVFRVHMPTRTGNTGFENSNRYYRILDNSTISGAWTNVVYEVTGDATTHSIIITNQPATNYLRGRVSLSE